MRIGTETPETSVLSPQALDLFCSRLGIPIEEFIPPLSNEDNVSFGTYPKD